MPHERAVWVPMHGPFRRPRKISQAERNARFTYLSNYDTPVAGARITPEELLAAQSSIWFNPNSLADGRGNLTPEANIAVLRGARYDSNGPLFFSDMVITDKAMRDLADYLGFSNVNDYNSALLTEQNKIFLRAPATAPVPATARYPFPVFAQNGQKQQLSDNPPGESEGTVGPRPKRKPSLFDTGYYYEGLRTEGAVDDFGNTGGILFGGTGGNT